MTLGDFLLLHGFEPVETTTYVEVPDKRSGKVRLKKIKSVNWQRGGKLFNGAEAQAAVWRKQGLKLDVNPRQLIKAAIANAEKQERKRSGEATPEEAGGWDLEETEREEEILDGLG